MCRRLPVLRFLYGFHYFQRFKDCKKGVELVINLSFFILNLDWSCFEPPRCPSGAFLGSLGVVLVPSQGLLLPFWALLGLNRELYTFVRIMKLL